jgi:hypothetical protein
MVSNAFENAIRYQPFSTLSATNVSLMTIAEFATRPV